jgi:hypothetical protein
MWTTKFWKDAAERVIRTAAQTAAASIGVTAAIQDVDWAIVAGTTATASVLSLLTALAAGATANTDNASFREDA